MKAVRMALEKKQPFARKAEAVGSKTAEVSVAHSGQWRDHENGGLRLRCSKPGQREGPLCAHGDGIIPVSHWSCCGARQQASSCKSGSGSDSSSESSVSDDDSHGAGSASDDGSHGAPEIIRGDHSGHVW